jgi:hypothetical protein
MKRIPGNSMTKKNLPHAGWNDQQTVDALQMRQQRLETLIVQSRQKLASEWKILHDKLRAELPVAAERQCEPDQVLGGREPAAGTFEFIDPTRLKI